MDVDPSVISAAISGVVNLITGYMTYRVGMHSAEKPKPDDETLHNGEQAMDLVKAAVAQHGDADEQADLASFERNPQRYTGNVERVLTDIANRNPTFAQQLQTLAQQANLQSGGVQGNVNVSGNVYGPTTGSNQGSITGNYTFNDRQDRQ